MKALIVLFLCLPTLVLAQKVNTTDEIVVSGEVKNPTKITIPDLTKFTMVDIGDIEITNHLGEKKGIAKTLKGIPLKTFLTEIQLKEDNPKLLSQFYFTFVALDNYKVVYSWNEIFNSPIGDRIFLVIEKEGKTLREMPESLLVVSASDLRTGRRYIKGLSQIRVERVR
jgi:hypothetical protein